MAHWWPTDHHNHYPHDDHQKCFQFLFYIYFFKIRISIICFWYFVFDFQIFDSQISTEFSNFVSSYFCICVFVSSFFSNIFFFKSCNFEVYFFSFYKYIIFVVLCFTLETEHAQMLHINEHRTSTQISKHEPYYLDIFELIFSNKQTFLYFSFW